MGLTGVRRAKGVRTTIPAKDGRRAGDLFEPGLHRAGPEPDLGDGLHLRAAPGPGSSTSRSSSTCSPSGSSPGTRRPPRTPTWSMTPLRMALWQRDRDGHPIVPGELIGHSDAGSQYTSIRFTEHLDLEGIRPSIGSVGDAYDNALMESMIGLYKTECIRTTVFHAGPYRTIADVEYATAGWVDW